MNGGSDFNWATDPEERNHLWKARHDIIYACMALRPGSKPYSTDVCVPVSKLPEVIVKTKQMIDEAGIIGEKGICEVDLFSDFEVIKLFSCSSQLRLKFKLLINTKIIQIN